MLYQTVSLNHFVSIFYSSVFLITCVNVCGHKKMVSLSIVLLANTHQNRRYYVFSQKRYNKDVCMGVFLVFSLVFLIQLECYYHKQIVPCRQTIHKCLYHFNRSKIIQTKIGVCCSQYWVFWKILENFFSIYSVLSFIKFFGWSLKCETAGKPAETGRNDW